MNKPNWNLFTEEKKKPISKRAELVKFFVDNLRNKENKKYQASFIAIKLSLFKYNDLEYLKDQCKDLLQRKGQVSMQKYFWYSINAKNVDK